MGAGRAERASGPGMESLSRVGAEQGSGSQARPLLCRKRGIHGQLLGLRLTTGISRPFCLARTPDTSRARSSWRPVDCADPRFVGRRYACRRRQPPPMSAPRHARRLLLRISSVGAGCPFSRKTAQTRSGATARLSGRVKLPAARSTRGHSVASAPRQRPHLLAGAWARSLVISAGVRRERLSHEASRLAR